MQFGDYVAAATGIFVHSFTVHGCVSATHHTLYYVLGMYR